MQETRFDLSQRDPQEQDMATPVFLLGKSHGKRSLVGYTPRSNKEWDTSEVCTHTHTHRFNPTVIHDNHPLPSSPENFKFLIPHTHFTKPP